jgi:hypothetical protein
VIALKWFYDAKGGIRSLAELQDVFHGTVGIIRESRPCISIEKSVEFTPAFRESSPDHCRTLLSVLSTGHNSFLMMDFAPTPEGLIAPDQVTN